MFSHRRSHIVTSLSAAAIVSAAALAATHPAAAASALARFEGAVSCATSAACIEGDNTSSGPGVTGTSVTGVGVTATGSTGLTATGTKSYGVSGTSTGSVGVKGTSYSYYGVVGTSNKFPGVYGTTTNGTAAVLGSGPSTGAGVFGTTVNGLGDGVEGIANGAGYGVYGSSFTGFGIFAYSSSATALRAESSSFDAIYATSYGAGAALNAESFDQNAPTIIANNNGGNGSDIEGAHFGMIGRAPAAGGYPLVLTDQNGNDLFFVDGGGNVYYKGTLNNFAFVRGGATVTSFTPRATQATVEDSGTAQLVNGSAAVRLDPTFAASIDPRGGYRVFITPGGDTHGLYVPLKTADGFAVREAQSGHSTVSFDYRILATALGQSGARMALAARSTMPNAPLPHRRNAPPSNGAQVAARAAH